MPFIGYHVLRNGGSGKKGSIALFSILSALFVLSMFYRVTNAVIAPNLISEFHLSAEQLGLLGGAFFYAFAILQIPLGPLLDRVGPRIIMTSFALAGAAGALIFALARSFGMALVGRALMGAGMAAVLMGALKVFTLRLPREKFASYAGLIIAFGTLGSILATSPFAYLASLFGWRTILVAAAAVTVILALLVFRVLKEDADEGATGDAAKVGEQRAGILQTARMVFGSLAFWQIAALAFCRYGTFVSLQGLWLGLYLMDVQGYSPIRAGNVLIMLAVGVVVGSPCAGWLYDRMFQSRRSVIMVGLILYCLSLLPLVGFLQTEQTVLYGLLSFMIGFLSGFGMLLYSHVKEIFPSNLSATVMAWVNFFLMAGGAFFTQVMGGIIQLFPRDGQSYPPGAYHLSFLLCFVCMGSSLIFYAFCKKK